MHHPLATAGQVGQAFVTTTNRLSSGQKEELDNLILNLETLA
jgi:hypothetical protein